MAFESLREKLNDSPRLRVALGVAAAVVLVAVLVGVGLSMRRPAIQLPTGRYFANEQTGELILEPAKALPPLNDASGKPVLVYAALYSTDGGKTKQAAYYEKYTDEAKQILANLAVSGGNGASPEQVQDAQQHGILVRLPAADSPWVRADTREGAKIIASMPTGPGVTQCSVVVH